MKHLIKILTQIKQWILSIVSKRDFEIEYFANGKLQEKYSIILEAKNQKQVIKKFNRIDCESRYDIADVYVC